MDAVLFDLDGTLIDTAELTSAAIIESAATAGHELTLQQLAEHTGGPLREWLAARLALTPDAVDTLYWDYVQRIKSRADQMLALDGADSLLRRLDAGGVSMAIVTTRLLEIALPILAAQGWSRYFQVVVGQETAARPKPAADPALYALQVLGIPPVGSAFVGDTEADIYCAREAGIGMVMGLAGTRPAGALAAAGATQVCSSLAEVEALLFGD